MLVSLQCNQSILFQGERNKRFVTFGLEQDDRPDLFRVRGEEVTPHSIYGFNLQIRDVFFMSQESGTMPFQLCSDSQGTVGTALVSRTRRSPDGDPESM